MSLKKITLSSFNINEELKIVKILVNLNDNLSYALFKIPCENGKEVFNIKLIKNMFLFIKNGGNFFSPNQEKNFISEFATENANDLFISQVLHCEKIEDLFHFDMVKKNQGFLNIRKNDNFGINKDTVIISHSVGNVLEKDMIEINDFAESNLNFKYFSNENEKLDKIAMRFQLLKLNGFTINLLQYKIQNELVLFVSEKDNPKDLVSMTIEKMNNVKEGLTFQSNVQIFNVVNKINRMVKPLSKKDIAELGVEMNYVSDETLEEDFECKEMSFSDLANKKDKLIFISETANTNFEKMYENYQQFLKQDNIPSKVERNLIISVVQENDMTYGRAVYFLGDNNIRNVNHSSKSNAKFDNVIENLIKKSMSHASHMKEMNIHIYSDIPKCELLNNTTTSFDLKENVKSTLFFTFNECELKFKVDLETMKDTIQKEKEVKIENKKNEVIKEKEKAKTKNKVKRKLTKVDEKIIGFQSKKSTHVFTSVIVKEDETKNNYIFYVVKAGFSKKGEREYSFKGINLIPKETLFENPLYFFKKIKGVMKTVSRSNSIEIRFYIEDKSVFKDTFLNGFHVLNEANFKNNEKTVLCSVKNMSELNSLIDVCLYNELKKGNVDDKNELIASEEHEEEVLTVYTDASFFKEKSIKKFGYGVVMCSEDEIIKEYMGVNFSPYTVSPDTSEFNAIYYALSKVRDLKMEGLIPEDKKVEIRCDCLNTVRFFNEGLEKKKLQYSEDLLNIYDIDIIKGQALLNKKELLGLTSFKWVKGHSNNNYNHKADMLAKKAYHRIDNNGMVEIN